MDFLIDDFDVLSILPIEVKSGEDYSIHSAIYHFLSTPDYGVKYAIVLSNNQKVETIGGITYMPIYYMMFL